jgi:sulfatase maturation enzyme AslB (radical SAM superfamily)
MHLSSFTIILTDQCNFDCIYCYPKMRRKRLDSTLLSRALDFFHRFFARECVIHFYGGEPLLAFEKIKQTVDQIKRLSINRRIKVRYSLTTNGSLLTDDVLDFLEDHEFSVLLSFDGLAQDISRKRGSFDFLVSVIPKILRRPRISLETNSVFTAETIGSLSGSVKLLIQLGIQNVHVAFNHRLPWTLSSCVRLKREMAFVRNYFRSHYEKTGDVPWAELREEREKAVYFCPAGLEKMALAADGTLWGCFLFSQYFNDSKNARESRRYCFGDVDTFIGNHRTIYPQILENYSTLRMDRFSTPDRLCLFCDDIEECWICPLAVALTSGTIGRIPASVCRGAKMWRNEKRLFRERFDKADKTDGIVASAG